MNKKYVISTLLTMIIGGSTFTMDTPQQPNQQGSDALKERDKLRVSALVRATSPSAPLDIEKFRASARECRNGFADILTPKTSFIRANLKYIDELREAVKQEDEETIKLYLSRENEFIRSNVWQDLTAFPKVENPKGMKLLKKAVLEHAPTAHKIREEIEKTSTLIKQKKQEIHAQLKILLLQKQLGTLSGDRFQTLLQYAHQEIARHKADYNVKTFEIGDKKTEIMLYYRRIYLLALYGIYGALIELTQ